MIIQIRGTSGSGKTTAMRAVMKALKLEAQFITGRKQPVYYSDEAAGVAILGGYESAACGGCDNIGSAARVFEESEALIKLGWATVLCEGLLLSEDTKWTLQIPKLGRDVRCLFLTTPLDECLRRVESRRKAAGNERPLNPKNTENRVNVIERARVKLLAAGIVCRRVSTEQASALALYWAGVEPTPYNY